MMTAYARVLLLRWLRRKDRLGLLGVLALVASSWAPLVVWARRPADVAGMSLFATTVVALFGPFVVANVVLASLWQERREARGGLLGLAGLGGARLVLAYALFALVLATGTVAVAISVPTAAEALLVHSSWGLLRGFFPAVLALAVGGLLGFAGGLLPWASAGVPAGNVGTLALIVFIWTRVERTEQPEFLVVPLAVVFLSLLGVLACGAAFSSWWTGKVLR